MYPCCEHCADDPIHDVPKDGHELPCTLHESDTLADIRRALAKPYSAAPTYSQLFDAVREVKAILDRATL